MCYAIIERRGKQKIAFLEVAWFTIWKKTTQNSVSKEHKKQI